MATLGAQPKRIVAGIGPAICQRSYEVGPEFPAPFLEQDARNAAFFCPATRPGHFHFDLKGYVARRLAGACVRPIQTLPCDTCAADEPFLSSRPACLRTDPAPGRRPSAHLLLPLDRPVGKRCLRY